MTADDARHRSRYPIVPLVIILVALGAQSAKAQLLPSQAKPGEFSVKTCEDAGVLVNVKSALEEHFKDKVTLGSDIRLQSTAVDAGITCSVSMTAKGTKDTILYAVAFAEAQSKIPIYVIEIAGGRIRDKIVRVVVRP